LHDMGARQHHGGTRAASLFERALRWTWCGSGPSWVWRVWLRRM